MLVGHGGHEEGRSSSQFTCSSAQPGRGGCGRVVGQQAAAGGAGGRASLSLWRSSSSGWQQASGRGPAGGRSGEAGRGLVGGGRALFEGVLGSRGCCRGGLKGLLGVVWPWPRAGAERDGWGWVRAQRRCWCWAVNSGRRAGRWQSVAAAPVVFCFGRPPRCAEQQHAPSQPVLH